MGARPVGSNSIGKETFEGEGCPVLDIVTGSMRGILVGFPDMFVVEHRSFFLRRLDTVDYQAKPNIRRGGVAAQGLWRVAAKKLLILQALGIVL